MNITLFETNCLKQGLRYPFLYQRARNAEGLSPPKLYLIPYLIHYSVVC